MFTSDRGKLNASVIIKPWPIFMLHWLKFMACFLGMLCFSGTMSVRAMKLGTFIHLVEGSWMHPPNKVMTLIFCFIEVANLCRGFLVKFCFWETIRARAMKFGTSIHQVEESWKHPFKFGKDHILCSTDLTNFYQVFWFSSISQEL